MQRASQKKTTIGFIIFFVSSKGIYFLSLPFFKYFRHHSSRLCPLVAIEKIGRKTVETVLASGVRPTPHEPTNSHTFQSVLHTLFAASGARARVTSVGREEGDINFCRKPAFLRVSLRAPPTGFDGCSFVVRSLNAGAGKERSIFNLRLHAKREERKSTNDALCDARARAPTRTQTSPPRLYLVYSDATAAITLGIPLERDGAKKVLLYVAFGLLH